MDFKAVKDKLDIVEVAKYYGTQVNGHNKALCPFHNDKRPSLSFKGERFKCFSCGASGSVIDFVTLLYGLSNVEAARKLDADFNLGLDRPLTAAELRKAQEAEKERQRDKALMEAFKQWEFDFYEDLCRESKRLRENKWLYQPRDFEEAFHPLFIEACKRLEYIEYLLDFFLEADIDGKIELYNTFGNEVPVG